MKMPYYLLLSCSLLLAATTASSQTYFRDVMVETGMNFVHQLDGTCPNPPLGSGSAWADYDNDGDIDFYITNKGAPSALFRNEGDTNSDGIPDFVDVALSLGVNEAGLSSHGVVFIDYDNDGDQDLYVTHWGGNTLYQNQLIELGSVSFVDVTVTAGVGNADRAVTAAWADYDADGYLDLYLAKHFDCMPNLRESRDALYKNNGDGTFTNVSQYLCDDGSLTCDQLNLSHAFTAGWFDFDNDNDLDLYIASDVVAAGYPNILWRNDGPDGSGGWLFKTSPFPPELITPSTAWASALETTITTGTMTWPSVTPKAATFCATTGTASTSPIRRYRLVCGEPIPRTVMLPSRGERYSLITTTISGSTSSILTVTSGRTSLPSLMQCSRTIMTERSLISPQ